MRIFLCFLTIICCLARHTAAQVSYNANTHTTTYNDYFLYGSNMQFVPGWTDEQLSEILIGNPAKNITGAGVNSLRPALYEYFVEEWGYNVRLSAFKLYQQLGAKNNTIFLNGPSAAHKDNTQYCAGKGSEIFANLYEPIWANGTVNNNNYYAKYVYNLVKTYGPYVKFWEVWNEPDYVVNWQVTQAWNTTNPNPCDLTNMYAPIQRYVRMLRITYEVVKTVDPSAFICVGGIGYPNFLDAILRNTDNPTNGSVAGEYTQKGGAWFDCVSFHIYPMYYLGNTRNSDAAAQSIITYKNDYNNVLLKYGYNGTTYPTKEFIITECNIPHKSFSGYIGSDEAQCNFLIKAAVACQKSGIQGLYVYNPSDGTGSDPYQAMGFYQPITGSPYNATPNPSATAWRTTSTLLKDRRYDKAQTSALQLPSSVDGAAFYSEQDKSYIYVLWAKATSDSETSSVTYNFPGAMDIKATSWYTWDYKTGSATGSSLKLTGSPIFVTASGTIIPVTGVTLNKTTTAISAGQSETLTATVAPANASNKAVTWSSSNTNVATVSASGTVAGIAVGSAVVTATTADGGKTATCSVTVTQSSSTVAVSGVSLNKSTTDLPVGKTETLIAIISPTNATNKAVTWASNDANIASVSNTGLITANKVGTATITVTTVDGNKKATCTVTVSPAGTISVTGVSLNKTTTTLVIGGSEKLIATIIPSNALNQSVTWSSSNAAIASVNNAGTVTAMAIGTATITVTTVDGNKTATCVVTVSSTITGVDDPEARSITAYPNPNDGRFTLNFEKQGDYNITIVNMTGKAVLRKTVSDNQQEMDISNQPAGIYLVVIDDGRHRTTIKIVKQ